MQYRQVTLSLERLVENEKQIFAQILNYGAQKSMLYLLFFASIENMWSAHHPSYRENKGQKNNFTLYCT